MENIISNMGYILLLAFAYRIIRELWISYITTKAEYELDKLRSEIRLIAIEKPKYDSKVFNYLDSSLEITLSMLPKLNIWSLIYFVNKHKKDTKLVEHKRKVYHILAKDTNFKESFEKYNRLSEDYVFKKNIFSLIIVALFTMAIKSIARVFGSIINMNFERISKSIMPIDEYPKYTSVLPETSRMSFLN